MGGGAIGSCLNDGDDGAEKEELFFPIVCVSSLMFLLIVFQPFQRTAHI